MTPRWQPGTRWLGKELDADIRDGWRILRTDRREVTAVDDELGEVYRWRLEDDGWHVAKRDTSDDTWVHAAITLYPPPTTWEVDAEDAVTAMWLRSQSGGRVIRFAHPAGGHRVLTWPQLELWQAANRNGLADLAARALIEARRVDRDGAAILPIEIAEAIAAELRSPARGWRSVDVLIPAEVSRV